MNSLIETEFKLDSDIEAMLNDVGRDWLKATDAYHLGHADGYEAGYRAGQEQFFDRELANIKNQMAGPAEMFYALLLKIIPESDIVQHRIGVDYDAATPTALTVISHKHADKVSGLLGVAADLEIYLFDRGCHCSFWVMTDDRLDQALIDHDFPYYRRVV